MKTLPALFARLFRFGKHDEASTLESSVNNSLQSAQIVESASDETLDSQGRNEDAAMIANGQIVESDRKYLVESEAERLIRAAGKGRHGARDRAVAMILYRHGLRVSELVGLRLDDLDLETARLRARRSKDGQSSTHPIDGETLRAIRRYLAIRPATPFANLFISERGEPFSRHALNYLTKTWGKRAELSVHVHPHMLRHSCGYALVNRKSGTDLRRIQEYLGHKDPKHTALYTVLAADRFKDLWGV